MKGVNFLGSGAFLKCALRDPKGPNLRIFYGHAGWGAQQLVGRNASND